MHIVHRKVDGGVAHVFRHAAQQAPIRHRIEQPSIHSPVNATEHVRMLSVKLHATTIMAGIKQLGRGAKQLEIGAFINHLRCDFDIFRIKFHDFPLIFP